MPQNTSFGKGYDGSCSKENCQKLGEINTIAMIDLKNIQKWKRMILSSSFCSQHAKNIVTRSNFPSNWFLY